MFGLDVCLWGVDSLDSNGFSKMLWNYCFYDGMGHTALKLTLPCSEQTQQWVEQYCHNPYGEVILPWQKTTTIITQSDQGRHFPKEVPCYDIYFSWWPQGLLEEKDDMISQMTARKSQWSAKGLQLLGKTQTGTEDRINIPAGFIGQWLNKVMPLICSWDTDMDLACLSRVHFGPNSKAFKVAIEMAESIENKRQEFLKFSEQALNEFNKPSYKLSDKDYELFANKKTQLKAMAKKIKQDILNYKQYLEEQGEVVGANPDHKITLPIDVGVDGVNKNGLNVKDLLEEMHRFATVYRFDIKWLNCSHAARYVLLAGLEGANNKQVRERLGSYQLFPSLWDNPSRMSQFAGKVQKAFIDVSLESSQKKLLTAFETFNIEDSTVDKEASSSSISQRRILKA